MINFNFDFGWKHESVATWGMWKFNFLSGSIESVQLGKCGSFIC